MQKSPAVQQYGGKGFFQLGHVVDVVKKNKKTLVVIKQPRSFYFVNDQNYYTTKEDGLSF